MKRCLTALGLLIVASGCVPENQLGHLRAQHFGDLSHGEPDFGAFDARIQAACGSGALTAAGDGALIRRPHVQQVTTERAALVFGSEVDAAIEIFPAFVREAAGEALVSPAPIMIDASATLAKGQQRIGGLETLSPAEVHCYELLGPEGPWSEPSGFFAASERGSRVRFSSFGDLGQATSDQFAVLEQLMNVESEFVLVNGDVAYGSGTRDELQRFFFDVYEPMIGKVPFFPALGNHDAKTENGAPLLEAFALPETTGSERFFYSIDWGDVHVAIINTESPTSEQAQWLASDLAGSDATWKIVVGHKPPYSSGSHGGDGDVKKTFEQVFIDQRVDLAMFGHEHNYERTIPINGITYVISGGGGVGTRPIDASGISAHANRVAHFVHLEATPEALTLWAIDATGQVFDTWQARK